MQLEIRIWREFNLFLLGCVVVLLIISGLCVYSATFNAVTAYGTPLNILFPRHIVNILLGLGMLFAFASFDYHLISGLALPFYLVVIGVLAVVLIAGKVSEGAQSWIEVGTRTFQPSEVAKLIIIVALATYFARFEDQLEAWNVQFGGLLIIGIPLLLILIQPDFGTALVVGTIWLTMAWCAGIRWQQLLLLAVVATPIIFIGWEKILDNEQKSRLLTFYWMFVNPSQVDPNEGYNITQSLNAIGSGGLFGAGLRHGILSQGNYIPVQYSDFIFAVVGEEMGFVGGLVLLTFEGLLLWLILSIAHRARDTFGRLVAIGIFGMFLAHLVVNVGMAMSILPVTGLPLPFISYGGSFTITALTAIGLLESITMRWRKIVF